MGMVQSISDPCVFYKHENNKLVLIAVIHVDDTMLAGKPNGLNGLRKVLVNALIIQIKGS
jgi:hypothetical protein